MKNIFLLFVLLPFFSEAQLTDNFSDGNFTSNPAWSGDDTQFIVNASQQLQLNSAGAATSYLSTPLNLASLDNQEWQFYIRQNFSPSSANFGRVYLVSDQNNLEGPLNGYYLQFGESGSLDAVELFRQTGTASASVARGTDGQIANSFIIRVKVTRDNAGLWKLFVDPAAGTNFQLQAQGTESTFSSSAFFGVVCTYTSSNSTGFYFDDFSEGAIIVDVTPPSVSSIINIVQNSIDVIFSEAVDQTTAENGTNYSVNNGIGNPASATLTSANAVQLTFASNFADGILNTLSVLNVEDLSSNAITIASTGQFTYFAAVTPSKYDVVINEIFPDPDPQLGLPTVEYIEIFNRSSKTFDLLDWKFSDTGTPQNFPSFTLTPGSYLIVCDDASINLFSSFGNVVGMPSFPSLNNDGDALKLYDASSNIIDEVTYDLTFYNDPLRDDGGYSIERVDPDFICANYLNWKASQSAVGGTPGTINSADGVFSDTQHPILLRALITGTNSVKVFFDEPMDVTILSASSTYSADQGLGVPVNVSASTDFTSVILTFSSGIQSGIIYTLTVSNSITDCAGNLLGGSNMARFALPDSVINASDIILNEVLFNPEDDGASFVELYNRSNKIFDLSKLKIANLEEGADTINYIYPVSSEGFLFFPGEYLALTEAPSMVKLQFETTNPYGFVTTDGIETILYTDEGTVIITDNNFNRIDQFYYSEDFHFLLLNDEEGVSLERISFNRPTQDSSNWHSAAETVGFATPAYENSQHSEITDDGSDFTVIPEIFSPDNDGKDDVVSFTYLFGEPGYTANLKIFNSKGAEVAYLVKNTLIGLEGVFSWDGISDENLKSPAGIYIALLEVFKTEGKIKKIKRPFVLATRL